MKKPNNILFIISTLFLLFSLQASKAQVYTASNYYYNNFDGGQLGSGIAQTSTSPSLQVASSAPLSGKYSWSSLGNAQAGSYKIAAVAANTNLAAEKYGWEWTLAFNAAGAADANHEWKYWLVKENDQANSKGCYLTQENTKLYLRFYENQNTLHSFEILGLELNATYLIRVQRLTATNKWVVYADKSSSFQNGAYTKRTEIGWNPAGVTNYNCSTLEVKSSTENRFKFDELKMYSMKLQISGANELANGISSPLYAGQRNAVLYGLKAQTRGLFDFYQFKFALTGSITSVIEPSSIKLNKSIDSYFGNADDSFLININEWWNEAIQYYGNTPVDVFGTVGTPDGSMAIAAYYFMSGNVKTSIPAGTSFAITGSPLFVGQSTQIDYAKEAGVVTETNAPVANAGNVKDWQGNTTDWNTATNWLPNGVPGANDLVRIGVNNTYAKMPILNSNVSVGNLVIGGNFGAVPNVTINAGATLTITGSFKNERASVLLGEGTLALNGNWNTVGGKIDLTTGKVIVRFAGSGNQSIIDGGSDSGKGVLFGHVKFANGGTKTFVTGGKFAVAVGAYLTMEGNTILQVEGDLTFKANANGSASVNAIPATAAIKGEVTVEKYIQGGSKDMWRTYRMLSSPIYDNTATFINKNEVGNRTYSYKQFIDDMIISGKGGAANGFDETPANGAGAWIYDNGFIALSTINTNVNVGRGVYLFYRGSRDNFAAKVNSPYMDAESIVMTFKGTLNQQSISVPLVHGSTGYSLVGNPYAATIDWNKVIKTNNVTAVVRIWNPSSRQYSTYNGSDGINGGLRYIGPGQGFFVQTTNNSAPSITFTEDAKVTDNSVQAKPLYNTVMSIPTTRENLKTMAAVGNQVTNQIEAVPARIRVRLLKNGTENSDETLVVLKDGGSAAYTDEDVLRYGGEAVFLSSQSSDAKELGINYMPSIAEVSKIKLTVTAGTSGSHTLQFTLNDIPSGFEVKLKDNYLNKTMAIQNEGTVYNVNIDRAVAASFGSDRFELLVSPPTTLPVVFSEFAGNKTNTGILLKWKTSSESNNDYFEVKRAGEDKIYTSIGTVAANQSGAYSLLDKSPLLGNNYYTLVQVDKDGKSNVYPQSVVVKYELNGSSAMQVYPTLVETNFTLKYTGSLSSDKYLVKIADATGKEVLNRQLDKQALFNGYTDQLPSGTSGLFFATLIDAANGKSLATSKLIKK